MANPNPTCTISGGATPADVAATTSISGALASTAGANYWSVTCVGTDESTTAATINATLVVNSGPKTFSFTSGALGTAYIFQSTVGIAGLGLDANNIAQPSFTTTFKVNVKTGTGKRVIAANEKFEQDPVNGWIAEVNAAIRAV